MELAELIDAYRIFPRLFFGVYLFLLVYSGIWAWSLPVLSVTQAGLFGGLLTAGAAWWKFYVDTGRDWNEYERININGSNSESCNYPIPTSKGKNPRPDCEVSGVLNEKTIN